MSAEKNFKRRLGTVAWGALLMWWGVVVMFDPLTIAIGAIGTGLIQVSVNIILSVRGIPVKVENIRFAIFGLTWGVLDQIRHMLSLPGSWSFALLLLVAGAVVIFFPLFSHQNRAIGSESGSV